MTRNKMTVFTCLTALLILNTLALGSSITLKSTQKATVVGANMISVNKEVVVFDIPEDLEGCRIDLAELKINFDLDTDVEGEAILCYPLASNDIGQTGQILENSIAFHDSLSGFCRHQNYMQNNGEFLVTDIMQQWIDEEMTMIGFVVHPSDTDACSFGLNNKPGEPNVWAELKIFYRKMLKGK